MENIEKRFTPIELRADKESRLIKGTAIVFNSESKDLGGFVETIKPESVTRELINNSDIVMLYNHNEEHGVLARSKYGKGSLNIEINENGVDFSFVAKRTAFGDEILQSVENGDLDACSFAFRIADEGDDFEYKGTGKPYLRTINKFESLHDLSIVVTPAYDATNVSSRSINKIKELREKELIVIDTEAVNIENKQKEIEFNKYLKSIIKQYKL